MALYSLIVLMFL